MTYTPPSSWLQRKWSSQLKVLRCLSVGVGQKMKGCWREDETCLCLIRALPAVPVWLRSSETQEYLVPIKPVSTERGFVWWEECIARVTARQMARSAMVEKLLWESLVKGSVSGLLSEHCRPCFCRKLSAQKLFPEANSIWTKQTFEVACFHPSLMRWLAWISTQTHHGSDVIFCKG